jgi:hypothetical protein
MQDQAKNNSIGFAFFFRENEKKVQYSIPVNFSLPVVYIMESEKKQAQFNYF